MAGPETCSKAGSEIRTSIIIVHYTGLDLLRDCLSSVLGTEARQAEVIVVDNASTDHCTLALQPGFPSVRFLQSEQNLGSSGGWNLGARAARGRILVFLNDDVVVTAGWLTELENAVTEASVGCASSLALSMDQPDRINSAGGVSDFLGFGFNRAVDQPEATFDPSDPPPLFFAVGTSLAIRREVFQAVGDFDPSYFMYADDHDWSWRARVAGYAIVLALRSRVYHKWRGSGLPRERMVFFAERNQLVNMLKCYSAAALLFVLPVLLAVKLARVTWLAPKFPGFAVSTLRAWGSVAQQLPDILRARRRVQATRRVSDREVFRHLVLSSLEVREAFNPTHPLTQLGRPKRSK